MRDRMGCLKFHADDFHYPNELTRTNPQRGGGGAHIIAAMTSGIHCFVPDEFAHFQRSLGWGWRRTTGVDWLSRLINPQWKSIPSSSGPRFIWLHVYFSCKIKESGGPGNEAHQQLVLQGI